jgi:hypothetical protein
MDELTGEPLYNMMNGKTEQNCDDIKFTHEIQKDYSEEYPSMVSEIIDSTNFFIQTDVSTDVGTHTWKMSVTLDYCGFYTDIYFEVEVSFGNTAPYYESDPVNFEMTAQSIGTYYLPSMTDDEEDLIL